MAATIKDVARESNISLATVSKYLNGKPVRRSTAEKVEAAIKAVGYHVNLNARSLRTAQSMTVGVLVDDIRNMFYCNIIHLLTQELEVNGYSVTISETRNMDDEFDTKMDFLMRRGVDGIIILTTKISAERVGKYCAIFPNIVVVDDVLNGVDCGFVVTDNIAAAYCATEQLIIAGHSRIATLQAPKHFFTAQERLTGYRRALLDYHIEPDEALVFSAGYDIPGGYEFGKWFATMIQEANRPTAVLVPSYFVVAGFITAMAEKALSVPKDFSMICIDCYDINMAYSPRLASYKQPDEELAASAVSLLLLRMRGGEHERRIIRIPAKYISGNSVGSPLTCR